MGGEGPLAEAREPGPCSGQGTVKSVYTWEQVQSHSSKNDQWLVIDRKVYNISQWAQRHPGGFRVIRHYAGEDATFVSNDATPQLPPGGATRPSAV